jgi:hypothetical protein
MNPPCCVLSGIPGWLYDLLQYDQLDAEIEAYMHMRHRFAVCNGSSRLELCKRWCVK